MGRNKRVNYLGASTLISVPPLMFESALAEQADETRHQQQIDQTEFDQAKAVYLRDMERFGLYSQQADAMRKAWRRVEVFFANLQQMHAAHIRALRRDAAGYRVKLRETERQLALLTNREIGD